MTLDSLEILHIKSAYDSGELSPQILIEYLLEKANHYSEYNIWIKLFSLDEIQPYIDALNNKKPDDLPLYGIPFAIKDNIDLAGVPTTAACEAFTYVPQRSAVVVQKLIDAGAIPLGKTNMDQFATGLVGTRSPEPWGIALNAFNKNYISGGSSSGSALAVTLGLVSFALGTDTAGSGRVPAAFNNIVGLKPSKGLISTQGVVPACRSLDCVSIFSLTCADANAVFELARGYDDADAYSRSYAFANLQQQFGKLVHKPRIGFLSESQLETFGDKETLNLYKQQCESLRHSGFRLSEIDFSPFVEAAHLLYQGPWVTERYIACKNFLDDMLDITREIISSGKDKTAEQTFEAQYRLADLKQQADKIWGEVDVVITPTTPSHYTIAEVNNEPVKLNSQLGYYTNFMNLLDYCALALPSGFKENALPFGVTFFSLAMKDINLLSLGHAIAQINALPLGVSSSRAISTTLPEASDGTITVAVCGAHLEGLPLNWQLLQREARLIEKTHTAACYQFYALAGGPPKRPGLIRSEQGAAIEVELWRLPAEYFGSFVAGIPQPLGIGKVELADGRWVVSFICEDYAIESATDITHLGSWRAYLKSL